MNPRASRDSAVPDRNADRYRPRRDTGILLAGLAAMMVSAAAPADNFANVHYSARTDQLIVTMAYRGTNPGHTFSLKWGACQEPQSGGRTIAAEVLDSQWKDVEQHDFKKTTRFSLADLMCRPSTVTLRSAPRFLYTLQIPARGSAH